MKRGFARPLLVIIVLILISLPIVARSNFIQAQFHRKEVKGSQVSMEDKYLNIRVISENGSWELIKYLCSSEEECAKSPESGKKIGSVGGGITTGQHVNIMKNEDWNEYTYAKFYVKSGLSSSQRSFSVEKTADISDAVKKEFKDTEVIIIPVSILDSVSSTVAVFSDK